MKKNVFLLHNLKSKSVDPLGLKNLYSASKNNFVLYSSSEIQTNKESERAINANFTTFCKGNDFIVKDFMNRKITVNEFLMQLRGNFYLVTIQENEIFVGTDKLGKDTVFYFYDDNGNIAVSNDFLLLCRFLIMNGVELKFNTKTAREISVYGCSPFRYETIMEGIKYLEPGQYLEIDSKTNKIKNHKYFEWKHDINNNLDSKTIIRDIYDLLQKSFDEIISIEDSKATLYAYSLSGGLDSRLIPWFLNSRTSNSLAFIISGLDRKSLIKHSHLGTALKKLETYYKLPPTIVVNYNNESFEAKLYYEISARPTFGSNLVLASVELLPKFDILITGAHGGVLFGEIFPKGIENDTDREIIALKIENILNLSRPGDFFLDSNEKDEISARFLHFVNKNANKNNIELAEEYFFHNLANTTKTGMFESALGTKKAYGFYLFPEFLDFFKTWPIKFKLYRFLQREFFLTFFSNLSKIPDETWEPAIAYRDGTLLNKIRTISSLGKYIFQKKSLNRSQLDNRFKLFIEYNFSKLLRDLSFNDEIMFRISQNIDVYERKYPRQTLTLAKFIFVSYYLKKKTEMNFREFCKETVSKISRYQG